ncbi:uncharacterized protein LOC144110541 [Amblyomma americanum]
MCMCETALQINILGACCLIQQVLNVFAGVMIIQALGYDARIVIGVCLGGASCALALLLLVAVNTNNKDLMGHFLLGAKIRILAFVLLLSYDLVLISQDKGGKARALHGTNGIFTFAGMAFHVLDVAKRPDKQLKAHLNSVLHAAATTKKPSSDAANEFVNPAPTSIILSYCVIIAIDWFVIWRIQVFTRTM